MPADPPRDNNGKIIPHDHADITDDHHVIRHTTQHDLFDGRIASGAFSESSVGGMSVDIEDWMRAAGLGSIHYVTNPTDGAVRLNVGELRNLGFQVGWDPDGGHEYHGAVWGIGNGSGRRRRIQNIATTVRRAQGENAVVLESVPVFAGDLTILMFDNFVLNGNDRIWIGSRRTLCQCREIYHAYCRSNLNGP